MANTTPSTPNTTDSGHPGNSMTHTGVDAHEGSTVTSNAGEHSHLHFDDGYKLHFGEIASLFEDIQADMRIITDRATSITKGLYKRDTDTIAPNAANQVLQGAMEQVMDSAGVLDLINAELGAPTNFADLKPGNFASVQNAGPGGYVGGMGNERVPGFAGSGTVPTKDGVYDATGNPKRPQDLNLAELEGSPLAPNGAATGNVKYGNQGSTRNRPIQQELMDILSSAASAASVDVLITSGGQLRQQDGGIKGVTRTGSCRHDNGFGADVALFKDGFQGQQLSSRNPEDLRIMMTFMKACRDNGATGIGQGNGYMSDRTIHVDISWPAQAAGKINKILPTRTWGGGKSTNTKTRYANAPQYMKDLMGPRSNT